MIKFLICLLTLLPFIKPPFITYFSTINNIYNILQILVAVFIIFNYIIKNKVSHIILIVFIMQLIVFFSTFLNDGNYFDVIKNSIQIITLCIIIEKYMKTNSYILFKTLNFLFYILIFIDFLSVILYPQGIIRNVYQIWFLGAKNNHLVYILPAIFCSYIYYFYLNKLSLTRIIKFALLCIMSVIIILSVKSMTSLVAIVLLLFFILLFNKKNYIFKFVNMKLINIFYIVFFVGIICFQVQNHFSYLIETVLQKDLSFTGRVEIWERSLYYISDNPLIGYGAEDNSLRIVKFNDTSALHCHNMVLELLYSGGIVLLIAFLVLWNKLSKKIDKSEHELKPFLTWILLVYCIELLTEVFEFEVFIWVLVLIYYCGLLKKNMVIEGDENV